MMATLPATVIDVIDIEHNKNYLQVEYSQYNLYIEWYIDFDILILELLVLD